MTDLSTSVRSLQERLTDFNADSSPAEYRHAEALAEAAQEVVDVAAGAKHAAALPGRFAEAAEALSAALVSLGPPAELPAAALPEVKELIDAARCMAGIVAWMVQAEAVQVLLPYGIFLPHRLLDQMLGERITAEEMGRLARAIPHSSIPDALQEILGGIRERGAVR